jgi:uncharacterized protein DUF5753
VARPKAPGNPALVLARHTHGWSGQKHLCAAFEQCARGLGLRLGVSIRQVRRWESANPPWPSPDYERVLETMFGVQLDQLGFTRPGHLVDNEDNAFRELRGMEQPGWWRTEPEEQANNKAHYLRLVKAEQSAIAVRTYLPFVLPGLLQTYEYGFALLRAGNPALSHDEVTRRAARRAERLKGIGPPLVSTGRSLWFVVSDQALRNPIGGWSTLADQLGHLLIVLSERPDVRFQVLPDDVGAHPGLAAGAFSIYDFGKRNVVYVEGLTGRSWTSRPTCLAAYSLAYSHLQAAALPVDASVERIAQRTRQAEMKSCSTVANPSGGRSAVTQPTKTAWRSPISDPSESATPRSPTDP